ncbi:DUF1996 domain-containing protein [Streptomyces stackebrandtii]|uniref:DUF1996 domain-containing protein n=1 Tax=Streptomyces stackebrandtii TaxID=3051177 RepID=UPI0028DBCD33|nr:DUF1996 domain-containing protein [Streptomyces sp. DSM 40976]
MAECLAPVPDGPRAHPGCREGRRQAREARQARYRKVSRNLPASAGRALQYQGLTDPTRAVAHPRGLRYVVGNALATGPEQNPAARWSCVGRTESGRDFMNCPPGTKLENYLDFPTCWDGKNLDSPNHRDHMTYATGPSCPASHPVPVPRLELLITWPVNGGGLSLAGTRNGTNVTDAPGYTFHGDFFNAWDEGELRRRVADCINAGYICGTDGRPIQQ